MKSAKTIAAMCALSLTLVACGGNAPAASDSGSGTEAQATQSAEPTQVEEKKDESVVGTWKIAALESNGITMTGDLATFASAFGSDEAGEAYNMGLDLKDGGKGSISMAGESREITWTQSGDAITITPEKSDEEKADDESEPTEIKATVKDGVLRLQMDEDEATLALMTKDGTYPDGKSYDKSAAKAVTAEDDLIGTWKLTGIYMMGITMSGDASALAEQFDYDDSTATFSSGGTAKLFGDEATFAVSADGAQLSEGSTKLADLLMLDDSLLIDMSATMGTEMFMVLSK